MATISRHQTVIFGIFTHLTAESAITREIQWVLTNRGYRRGVPVPPPPAHGRLDSACWATLIFRLLKCSAADSCAVFC